MNHDIPQGRRSIIENEPLFAPGSPTGDRVSFYRNHIVYLRHVLRQSSVNNAAFQQLEADHNTQHRTLQDLTAANNFHKQRLEEECSDHAYTKHCLDLERRDKQRLVASIALQQESMLRLKAAHEEIERMLDIEKRQCHDLTLELDRTQRKFHLIDSIVDTMLLEEDSMLVKGDRSRQITDVILDLEDQMEAKYRKIIEEQDKRIATLKSA
ncbi:hypothetical protein BO82DRAFT_348034 [Aspergillus uvarum CBS 121591]|uniref:Uncharacterized protein n=2 Tax=Aspergillus subgen. Circumdati TaxID=2720871 RepID=A0A319BR42_9EURO|nr:hypothetical protein BO82DRAFT_348034 [Aspergillus uvarum CBS 121591]XP_025533492.1 hypothetical protein BO86DRAFT_351525 [Aspergillus japonicus CBS 114.51]PYH75996.1 hypothetical protein BO82DRAFT_348034 [Aspergillus uvarum CBS 121591]RAH87598.1 hypothetical protein BO86DRAFT_351525 [Aspergillus japonicus CBS 114.51]